MKTIRVVSALITDSSGYMLMALRPHGVTRPNCWENPGGKIDPGETDRQALIREIREELGCNSKIGALISVARFELEAVLILSLYECQLLEEPRPLASQKLAWILPTDAITTTVCAPATYLFYPDIVRRMRGEA